MPSCLGFMNYLSSQISLGIVAFLWLQSWGWQKVKINKWEKKKENTEHPVLPGMYLCLKRKQTNNKNRVYLRII